MSSSRSIAAARNRRANEQQAPTGRVGPGTSIASQSAFSQQMQNQARISGGNRGPVNIPTPPQSQQINIMPATSVPPPNTKMSISDAIGLITLRLGRLEQFMYNVENGGLLSSHTELPPNTQLVDKSVLNSIINRLDVVEKSQKDLQNNNSNIQQTSKVEQELRDMKDALMLQIVKYDKFSHETSKKFSDIANTFSNMELNISSLQNINNDILNDYKLSNTLNDDENIHLDYDEQELEE
jgi:hypothetical protein